MNVDARIQWLPVRRIKRAAAVGPKKRASGRRTSVRVWALILNETSTNPDRIMRWL